MFKKSFILTALCASSMSLSGCSTMWSMASEFSADMAEVTKFSFLRGLSSESDVSFAEAVNPSETGTYKTDVGEYVPTDVKTAAYNDVELRGPVTDFNTELFNTAVDTSPHPCPDGTYLTEEETCMSLEVDNYDFSEFDAANATKIVDTSQHDCPEDTYLNDKNQCMFFETETFDFEDDVNFIEQTVDTSPLPCPDETYLTADGTCQFLNTEPTDFSANIEDITVDTIQMTENVSTATPILPAAPLVPSNAVATNLALDCPEGFKANADNSCMYLGAELKE